MAKKARKMREKNKPKVTEIKETKPEKRTKPLVQEVDVESTD